MPKDEILPEGVATDSALGGRDRERAMELERRFKAMASGSAAPTAAEVAAQLRAEEASIIGRARPQGGRAKVWVTVMEVDGELIVFGDGGANGNAGNPLVRYKRTPPADESRAANWADELVTDVTGVVRAAMTKIARNEGENVRFER